MKAKVTAALVASALATPGAALAQSSVTISGFFKLGAEHLRLGQSAKSPSNEMRVADDASRIIFGVAEDLGGGLQAIGQVDWRVTLDAGADAAAGNNFVGLRSKNWGSLTFGRHDLHYNSDGPEITAKAGSKKAGAVALLAFAAGGGTAIAGNTRTANTLVWDSPKWGAFDLRLAYSTNPVAPESDIGSGVRKGRAWSLNPRVQHQNFQAGYSYWSQKADGVATPGVIAVAGCAAGGAVTISPGGAIASTCATSVTITTSPGAPGAATPADQRGDRLYGSYTWGGFRLGLAWDKSKLKAATTGVETSNRTAWSIPARYRWGNHNLHADFTKARDDKATAAADGARMLALAYVYDLSKRTSVGISYARIRNDAAAVYNFDGSAGGQGSASGAVAAGEDPRIVAATVRHAF